MLNGWERIRHLSGSVHDIKGQADGSDTLPGYGAHAVTMPVLPERLLFSEATRSEAMPLSDSPASDSP